MVRQILLVNTLGNVWRTVWRRCMLMLGYKGLEKLQCTYTRTKLAYQCDLQNMVKYFSNKSKCLCVLKSW